ncbi:ABC transporter ATP-binding protein [Candidatus Entotheonella palauensis]|uniref:ABC transporter domain-containing protein n=1 Tax=Candidatus Entotheonella gemina TaxID=1429439 RepID=W4M8A2_9BACT|nr:ABC transporter ATP-binding protein [Candidatus Entotheonella palauensis]ETX06403.1 MAG: hypothetical protein ETSY2_17285 [Candidatus Entotheonella gemina]
MPAQPDPLPEDNSMASTPGALSPAHRDDTVIAVHRVGKMYRLYDRPQDRLKHQLLRRFGNVYGQEFWALKDVSFEVKRGEIVGIIGCNGSGKSTLLQLLAGVLRPTAGTIQVQGRVAALLELGSGFNPEYTGRENVFMNGAILGVSRAEMENRFEQIAAFAEIGDFIDQPVKVYSSGMFLRLAFAVSVHVDADILLIDEALAVGDVFFRQKCYQHLDALHERGVTIVLVTHGMLEVEERCQHALLLHHGTVAFQGVAAETVRQYYLLEQEQRLSEPLHTGSEHMAAPAIPEGTDAGLPLWPAPEAFMDITSIRQISNGWARCTGIAVCNAHGQPCVVFQQGETASFFYEFELLRDIEVPIGGLSIHNDKGMQIHGKNTLQYDVDMPAQVQRGTRLRFRQDIDLEIAIGEYTFTVGLATLSQHDFASRSHYADTDLGSKIVYLCQLPASGQFEVVLRRHGKPIQLLHYGAANLPSQCHATVVTSPEGGA